MTTGIVILACGHPYYGNVATNLAMSLKSHSNLPIHLVWHGKALAHVQDRLKFFDSMSECPEEAYMKKGFIRYFKAKTFMYDLSPFDNTLFLDADIIWLNRPVDEIINQLSDVDFTIQNRGFLDLKGSQKHKYFWANYGEMQRKYSGVGTSRLYSLHSEFVWFKKTEENKKYFDRVKEIYENPPVHPEIFAGDVADELAFGIACIEQGKEPHQTPFVPVYWQQLDKNDGLEIPVIQKKYYGYSVGGNSHPRIVEEKYNILARAYASQNGLSPQLLKKKKGLLPERNRM